MYYEISYPIKHCQFYITLLRAQLKDGSIRGAETCCC